VKRESRVPADAPRREIARWKWLIRWIRYPRVASIHRVSRIHRVNGGPLRQLPVLLVLSVLEWPVQVRAAVTGKGSKLDRRLKGQTAGTGPCFSILDPALSRGF